MNYIRHLTGFFYRAANDHSLNATHISLYVAIFQLWNLNRFKNPISLSRSEVMGLSKVGSKTTYHKCLKDLQQYGYLRYDPSYHPLRGSWVYLFDWSTEGSDNQANICPGAGHDVSRQESGSGQNEYRSSSETHASKGFQSPLNIYKHNKHIKHTKLSFSGSKPVVEIMKKEKDEVFFKGNNLPERTENFSSGKVSPRPQPVSASAAKKKQAGEKKNIVEKNPGEVDPVIKFFLDSGYPESEAVKFFYYYSATGWKVGGRSRIENWHSAAHSWMINARNTSTQEKPNMLNPGSGKLHATTNKNYSEPL